MPGIFHPWESHSRAKTAMRIWLTVKPQARREEVNKVAEGKYTASVRAPAREGKANDAWTKLLAGYFSVPRSSVKIIRGQTSRRKLVEIE